MTRTAPAACYGVGNVCAVHRRPALCVARAFQVDVSVGSTNDSGNQWQGAFKALVHVRSVAQCLLGDRL
jgi:hypothetical protein